MNTNIHLPEPELGYIKTDKSNQPAFSARQMREAMQARSQVQCELDPYAAGLLNDFGGGNVEWWQDYIRAELGHAHDFYQSQITAPQPAQATQPAEVTDEQILKTLRPDVWMHVEGLYRERMLADARAILALRPERVPMTDREIELIDGMIAVQLDHAQRCDAISNRVMAEKQKGWDMERVELLRRIRAQAKKETP